ncbi:MAG TPA: glycosyltransferase [Pseudonocardiaceae bacterium]|nr:glycosyltransferase [Pseudonocardiaceae bacterium]
MKVLHVITGLGVGGAELQLRSILQHTRHDSDVVTLYNPGPVAEMITGDGRRVRDLGMTRNTELPAVLRLARLIRAGRYHVVHVHLYRSCIYGRLAARLAGTPVVVTTEHSIGETHLERRKMTLGVRALYLGTDLCSDATISVSPAVSQRLIRWGVRARKIELIPNGLDFNRIAFDPDARARIREEFTLPQDAYVIGVLGRLDPIKRFDMVIKAAAPLLDDQHRLLIVGDGKIRSELEAEAAKAGVSDLVTFAGERHDVAAMFSSLDLFIAASDQETFGLSVLEALANGIPALYTTCPALDGITTDRARQVPGTVEGLRQEIAAEMAGGPRQREGVPAIREMYGIESVTRQIDDLYERLLQRRRSARGAFRLTSKPRQNETKQDQPKQDQPKQDQHSPVGGIR